MSTQRELRPPTTLAERFWSLAAASQPAPAADGPPEPHRVARHVLGILDELSSGAVGDGVSVATVSFLQLLRQQELAGDLSYASPEQARGETLDERSLVFSVGVLLFERLTGRHPFGAVASPRRVERIARCELGSGVQYFPQVPPRLRTVLMRAMGPFPEERYGSLAELRAELEAFAEERAAPLAPPRPLVPQLPAGAVPRSLARHDETPTRTWRRASGSTPPRVVPVPKRRSLLAAAAERAAWIALGAVAAAAAARFAMPSAPPIAASAAGFAAPPAATVERRVEARTAAAVAVDPVAAVETKTAVATQVETTTSVAAKSATVAAAPPVAVVQATVTPLGRFEVSDVGARGLAAVRRCFGGIERPVAFGAGLLFRKGDPRARKVYLSPDDPLSPEQRHCVAESMGQVQAGAAPDQGQTVEMRLRVRPGGMNDEVHAKLAPN